MITHELYGANRKTDKEAAEQKLSTEPQQLHKIAAELRGYQKPALSLGTIMPGERCCHQDLIRLRDCDELQTTPCHHARAEALRARVHRRGWYR